MKVGDLVRVLGSSSELSPFHRSMGFVVRVEWGGRCSAAYHARNNGLDGKGAWRQLYAHVRFLEENGVPHSDLIREDRLEVISQSR